MSLLLYTYHTPGHDITKPVDITKTTDVVMGPEFVNAYKWLYGLLNISSATWCYNSPSVFHLNLGTEYCLYTLKVPRSKILARISSDAWWHVYSNIHYYPPSFLDLPENECETAIQNFCATHSKESTWQEHIFKIKPKHGVEYLLPNPVPKEWIVSKTTLSGFEDLSDIYRNCFRTLDDAVNWYTSIRKRWEQKQPWQCYITQDEYGYTFHIGTDDYKPNNLETEFIKKFHLPFK
jgi:hypothetical protein